jgi:hypothetical protein
LARVVFEVVRGIADVEKTRRRLRVECCGGLGLGENLGENLSIVDRKARVAADVI